MEIKDKTSKIIGDEIEFTEKRKKVDVIAEYEAKRDFQLEIISVAQSKVDFYDAELAKFKK